METPATKSATLPTRQAMTPESQRIAIAEACGWTVHHGDKYVHPKGQRFHNLIVDPLDDLNAMHEAEKVLGPKWTLYQDWLIELTKDIRPREPMWHATAAQRAEAFLRTLGLWKDEASHLSQDSTTARALTQKK